MLQAKIIAYANLQSIDLQLIADFGNIALWIYLPFVSDLAHVEATSVSTWIKLSKSSAKKVFEEGLRFSI